MVLTWSTLICSCKITLRQPTSNFWQLIKSSETPLLGSGYNNIATRFLEKETFILDILSGWDGRMMQNLQWNITSLLSVPNDMYFHFASRKHIGRHGMDGRKKHIFNKSLHSPAANKYYIKINNPRPVYERMWVCLSDININWPFKWIFILVWLYTIR